MSKPISKQRPGGGQPQSNQRPSMPDYPRQDRPNYPLRQGNTPGVVHAVQQTPISQVTMHSQHQPNQPPQQALAQQVLQPQPQNMMRPGPHFQQNPQALVPPQQMQVGHVNANPPQQANVAGIPQHVMRNNQQPFPYSQLNQNRMAMPSHRPQYPNHHHRNNNAVQPQQIPNMPQQPNIAYYMYAPHNMAYIPQLMQPVNYGQPMILPEHYQQQMRAYNAANQPQMNLPNNIQSNEMISQAAYQQTQNQPPKVENRKREKKMLKICDENGQEVNLNELVNDSKSNAPKESSNEKTLNEVKSVPEETPPSQTPNGTQLDKEEEHSIAEQTHEETEKIESTVVLENNTEESVPEPSDSIQVAPIETSIGPSNIECDNSEVIQDTKESTIEQLQDSEVVDELAEKVEDIVLEDASESTDMAEVIAAKEEESASMPANDSEVVSSTTISGDMEVGPIKGASDPPPTSPSKTENTTANEDSTPSPDVKDEDDNEADAEQKLSRNSSQNGSRVYDKDFLLSLREHATDHAISTSNAENIKDIIKKNNKAATHDMFIPSFANQGRSSQNDSRDSYRNKSQTQAVRRPSQPSKNYQDSKSRKITSTSLHQHDGMYTPNENAWRPGKLTADDPVEAETENLLKMVRAILNKLTPQNYHTLLQQFKTLKIDTKNRLTRVIDLIFDKAVKEPSFVVQYAGFCSELIQIKVTETNAKGEVVEVKFKNLLIKKCEETFFREMYSDIDNFEERLKEIEECADEKRKKELDEILDDDKRLSRRRSIGNIKLIAELYKLNMLNAKIMFSCFHNLLKHQHEEYIECLCALITNIGLNLTNAIKSKSSEQMDSFESIFTQLKEIYDYKSKLSVSSRIRFMILDLLDLRKNNWVPRRKADGPKTIAQVHEDMDKEARLKSLELSEQRSQRNKKNLGPRDRDEEWQQVSNRKGKGSSVTGQGKLSISNLNVLKESLSASTKPAIGSGSPFGMFAHGSHGGTNSNSQSRSSSSTFENKYHVLANDKNPKTNSTFHDSLNAKDQLRRDERKTSDVTNYYQSNRDSMPNSRNSSTRSDYFEIKPHLDIDSSEFSSKLTEFVKTYSKSPNFSQAMKELVTFCSKDRFNIFISDSILNALEKPSPQRQNWGEFLGELFVYPVAINPSEIFEGFKAVFQMSDELLIDLPKFWEFVAEIIAYALVKVYESNDPRCKEIFKEASRAFGEVTGKGYIKLSGSIADTLTQNEDSPIASAILSQLNLNSQNNAKNDIQSPESNQLSEVNSIVDNFFDKFINSSNEISALEKELNIDKVDSKKFVSALFNKVVTKYIENTDRSDPFQAKIALLLRHFVKQNEGSENELVVVTSDVWVSLNHPSNLLLELFTLFYNEKVVTQDAFLQWQNSKKTPAISVISVQRFLKTFS